jgi:hypothetical protein
MNSPAPNPSSYVLFLNLKSNRHSRSRNYFNGLRNLGISCEWVDIDGLADLRKIKSKLKNPNNDNPSFVVTSPSHILAIGCLFSFFRRPVLDAGWPLYDGVITSRREYGLFGSKLLKTLLIDLLAFQFSKKVLVESEGQKRRISRRYFVPRRKISVLLTGFDEMRFSDVNRDDPKYSFNVLFRGGAQEEAGLDVFFESDQFLMNNTNLRLRVVTNNFKPKSETQTSIELVNRYLSDDELQVFFAEADLILGQLSDHKRLNFTIPHKFFEAAFLAKPYLTSDIGFMNTLAHSKLVYTFNAGNASSLASSIVKIASDRDGAIDAGKRLGDWYSKNASQKVLSEKFKQIVCGD